LPFLSSVRAWRRYSCDPAAEILSLRLSLVKFSSHRWDNSPHLNKTRLGGDVKDRQTHTHRENIYWQASCDLIQSTSPSECWKSWTSWTFWHTDGYTESISAVLIGPQQDLPLYLPTEAHARNLENTCFSVLSANQKPGYAGVPNSNWLSLPGTWSWSSRSSLLYEFNWVRSLYGYSKIIMSKEVTNARLLKDAQGFKLRG
jgi:hypothetical protein